MANDKMKAVIYNEYGPPDVLKITETEKPVPKSDQILVKIHATGVSSGDVHLRKADPFAVRLFFGLLKPKIKILGFAFAGEVESAGGDVKMFKTGDRVFGTTGMNFGAYAEFAALEESGILAKIPGDMKYTDAAAIPFGGNTALFFLMKADIKAGQKVLIYGASGAVGTSAVQIAKYFGAEVTGVCSTANIDLVSSLGADKVIDYKTTDFTKSGEKYDVIFDTIGKSSFSGDLNSLNENGYLILSSAGAGQMLRGMLSSIFGKKKVITGIVKETAEEMLFLKELVENGKLKPVVDRTYTLEQISEAHAYVEKGHKKGNVIITV